MVIRRLNLNGCIGVLNALDKTQLTYYQQFTNIFNKKIDSRQNLHNFFTKISSDSTNLTKDSTEIKQQITYNYYEINYDILENNFLKFIKGFFPNCVVSQKPKYIHSVNGNYHIVEIISNDTNLHQLKIYNKQYILYTKYKIYESDNTQTYSINSVYYENIEGIPPATNPEYEEEQIEGIPPATNPEYEEEQIEGIPSPPSYENIHANNNIPNDIKDLPPAYVECL